MSAFKYSRGKGVDLCLSWVTASNGEIPAGAIHVGDDVYVARSMHNGEMIPGKVASGHNSCYMAYGGEEQCNDTFQVLCDTCDHNLPGSGYEWMPWSGDTAPKNGLIGGTNAGTPLYVARAQVEGEWCAGKFYPDSGLAYFSYGGQEHALEDGFEVLVICKRSG